jgi:hypothetical protein
MFTYEISAATVSEAKELKEKVKGLPKHYPFEYEWLDATTFDVKVEDEDADTLADFLEENKITHRSV